MADWGDFCCLHKRTHWGYGLVGGEKRLVLHRCGGPQHPCKETEAPAAQLHQPVQFLFLSHCFRAATSLVALSPLPPDFLIPAICEKADPWARITQGTSPQARFSVAVRGHAASHVDLPDSSACDSLPPSLQSQKVPTFQGSWDHSPAVTSPALAREGSYFQQRGHPSPRLLTGVQN